MNINAISNTTGNAYSLNKNLYDSTAPQSEISFKGAEKEPTKLTKMLADTYGKAILASGKVRKGCKTLANKGNASRHFQVVGSLVTSSAYMYATLKNKDLDKTNANTLAINEGLCFIVPTVLAYLIDAGMESFNKTLEYKYSALQEKKIELGQLDVSAKEAAVKKLGKGLKGFRTMMGIITFTAVYRYLSPVAVTPLANKFGNWLNKYLDKDKNKTVQEPENELSGTEKQNTVSDAA